MAASLPAHNCQTELLHWCIPTGEVHNMFCAYIVVILALYQYCFDVASALVGWARDVDWAWTLDCSIKFHDCAHADSKYNLWGQKNF